MELVRALIRSGVRGVVAIAMTGASIGFIASGTQVPEQFWMALATVLAFFFASQANGNSK